jgi:nucleotide-binding universal stress UspA family protein
VKILLCVEDDPVLDEGLLALERLVALTTWSEIVVLHVVPQHPFLLVGSDAPPARVAEALLERVTNRLSSQPVKIRRLVASGEPASEIVRVADELQADLIVMGARGEREDFLMGSVSQKVVSMAPTDVLVARAPLARVEPRPRGPAFEALVAVDGSVGSEAGIDAFARKLRARDAAIRVVHVVESVPRLWDVARGENAFFHRLDSRARRILARAAKSLESYGLRAECLWRRGSPAAQILDSARELRSDLIVVGSRGHLVIGGMVLGSITHRVLRHAPCTVFCARGWAPESGALTRRWSSEGWEPEAGMA